MKMKMVAKSARWGRDMEDEEEDGGEGGVEMGKMKKKMPAKCVSWGGDREDEEEDGGEECDVG